MTAQIHENLILDGKMTSMAFCPPIPQGHPRITEIDPETVTYTLFSDEAMCFSTACWRRYQGTWEIRDGRFYLVGLRGLLRLEGTEPLLADWFSGVIRIPKGKELLYIHMGFGTVYEKEIHMKIDKGVVVATRTIDNRGKEQHPEELHLRNYPGFENYFPGDDEM